MFKLVFALAVTIVAAVSAKPQQLLLHRAASIPLLQLQSETSIESHGNSVVHHGAGPAPAQLFARAHDPHPFVQQQQQQQHHLHSTRLAPAALLTESKTIESHGNSVVHAAAPVVAAGYAAAAPLHPYDPLPLAYAAHPYPAAHYYYY